MIELKEVLGNVRQKNDWAGININLELTQPGLFTKVDIPLATTDLTDADTKKEVEVSIQEEILARFDRASSAEVGNGALIELLCNSANATTAMEILKGKFMAPEETSPGFLVILTEIMENLESNGGR